MIAINEIVIEIITFLLYSPSCLSQVTATVRFELSCTLVRRTGDFAVFLSLLDVKQENCEYQSL